MKVSYARLTDITGHTFRTIKKALEEAGIEPVGKKGNAILFDCVEALNAILGPKSVDNLDLQQERANLARKQAEKAELQIAQMKGELVDAEEVRQTWTTYRQPILLIVAQNCSRCLRR